MSATPSPRRELRPTSMVNDARLLREDAYLTYPHSNGFRTDGRRLVVGVAGAHPALVEIDLAGGQERVVLDHQALGPSDGGLVATDWSRRAGGAGLPWFDVSLGADTLVTTWGHRLRSVDLSRDGARPRTHYRPPPGHHLHELTAVSTDGSTAWVSVGDGRAWELLAIDLKTDEVRTLVRKPWWANHVHPVPHDETWVMFSHEGPTSEVADRMWAWHAEQAPNGRAMVDQYALGHSNDTPMSIGHERASFAHLGGVVVAYGESPVGPRGVYQTFLDGRPPRLVSPGERDWHVSASRDGAFFVVDTTGVHDRPGRGWAAAGGSSSIVLIHAAVGNRRELARTSHLDHPYHPHPCFTPDATAVLFNHVDEDVHPRGTRRGVAIVSTGGSGA